MDTYFLTHSIMAGAIWEDDPVLFALIIIGAVALIAGLIVLYFLIFKNKSLDKKVAELESSFSTAHGLLFGEISTAIKRLESIGSVNLCYVDEYAKENREYKDIRNVSDAGAQTIINELKDFKQEKRYKELKEALPKAKESINEYVASVNSLKEELDRKFKVENECKELESKVKTDVRAVKMLYNNHASELKLVVSPLTTAFSNLDKALENIADNIESAHYDEAKTTMGKVDAMVAGLNVVLRELPQICIQLSSVLPDKIISLKNKYDDLTKEGYPLNQVITRVAIDGFNLEIENMKSAILRLSIDGVNDKINAIHGLIDKANEGIDGEIAAKTAFMAEKDDVLSIQNNTSGHAINLNRDLEKVQQIFVLDQNDLDTVKNILSLDEQASTSKRILDTLLNSSTKQPYTTLLTKLHTLRDQAEATKTAVDSFEKYLLSLKQDVLRARQTDNDYYLKLKEIESYLHDTCMPNFKERYSEKIDNLYSYIDELSKLVQMRPIDVKLINKIQAQIVNDGNALIQDVNQQVSNMNQAECGIVNANRNRAMNAGVNSTVTQAEHFFFNGEFEEAMNAINSIPKDIENPEYYNK